MILSPHQNKTRQREQRKTVRRTYYKYRCAKCGRIYYARLVMVDKDNGYYGSISESKYNNAEAGENLLVI